MPSKKALSNCLRHIGRSQQENGGFLSLAGDRKFRESSPRRTTFAASLILACLKSAQHAEGADRIARRGVAFLLQEKSDAWTFNYWQRSSPEAETMRYPDDLDDTFCALQALFLHAPDKLEPEAFVHIVSALTSTEEKPGGPYNTWLVPDIHNKTWHDIDVAVNSNIAFFMKHQDVRLPHLVALAEEAISKAEYGSKYYHSIYPILYFISRFYGGDLKRKAAAFLLSRQKADKTWGDPLSTALAVSALVNFGTAADKLQPAIAYLERIALKDRWDPYPLFIEEAKGRTLYMGSSSLTAAFVLEALAKAAGLERPRAKAAPKDKAAHALKRGITERFEARAAAFGPDLEKTLLGIKDRVLSFDKGDQILLLPHHFLTSLKKPYRSRVSRAQLAEFGYGSLCGWIAYTLYDDLLDHESTPAILPAANVCLREVATAYGLQRHPDSAGFFQEVMDKLESANDWEYRKARIEMTGGKFSLERLPSFGSYEVLAHKSLGHVLAPAHVLLELGFSRHSAEFEALVSFFTHYIIARQLNDDAHDWLEDLERGFVNSSSEKILSTFMERQDLSLPLAFDLAAHRTHLEEVFWNETIDVICRDIFGKLKRARKALDAMETVENRAYFEGMLTPIERSAKEALDEKRKVAAFLTAYTQ